MSSHLPLRQRNGTVLQSGIPKYAPEARPGRAAGLQLKGVVVATYVIDDPSHPRAQSDQAAPEPVAVYCDVLVYSNMPGMRWRAVSQCLVLQKRGGLHDGEVWKPKASTIDTTGNPLDYEVASNPADFDGDHVLIGFMNDNLNEPIIMGGIPHPSSDVGASPDEAPARRRLRLRLADGDPNLVKHHGTVYGVESSGDFTVDSRFANDGTLDAAGDGKETDPPTSATNAPALGSQTFQLPLDPETTETNYTRHKIAFYDMSDPTNPSEKVAMTFHKEKWDLTFTDSGMNVVVDDAVDRVKITTAAGLQFLVDGQSGLIELGAEGASDFISLNSKVQAELSRIKGDINTLADALARHRHPQEMYFLPLIPNPGVPIGECTPAPIIYGPPSGPFLNLISNAEPQKANAPIDEDAGPGQFVLPDVPPNPDRISGLFPDASDPGDTASAVGTLSG